MKRTIAIGDVHGCLEELQELLRKIQFQPSSDRLVFVGDVLDEGPDSPGVLKLLRGLGAECVLGDHEHAYVQHFRHGTPLTPAQQALADELDDGDVSWLLSLPPFIELGTWDRDAYYVVHGGFEPGLLDTFCTRRGFEQAPLSEQRAETVCSLRFVSPHGFRVRGAGSFTNRNGETVWRTPKEGMRWTRAWSGGCVVYSHSARSSHSIRFDNGCFAIDTGCVYGGKLSALVLSDDGCHDILQVQAHRSYVEPLSAAA